MWVEWEPSSTAPNPDECYNDKSLEQLQTQQFKDDYNEYEEHDLQQYGASSSSSFNHHHSYWTFQI